MIEWSTVIIMQHTNKVFEINHCMVNFHINFFLELKNFFADCQGKVCLYNGTLDLNTCECQCSTYADGSYCEKCNSFILGLNIFSWKYFSKLFNTTFVSLFFINIMCCCWCPIRMSSSLWFMWSIWNIEKYLWWREFSTGCANHYFNCNYKKKQDKTRVPSNKNSVIIKEMFSSHCFDFRTRSSSTPIMNTTTPMTLLSTSSTTHPPYHMIFYLFIKYFFVV
jgi:hypothetical protein